MGPAVACDSIGTAFAAANLDLRGGGGPVPCIHWYVLVRPGGGTCGVGRRREGASRIHRQAGAMQLEQIRA